MAIHVTGYQKCSCGAITVFTDKGEFSCRQRNLKKFFPNLDLRSIPRYSPTVCCNHCVNHYGLDLCGCGSGAKFGKCKNHLEECEVPMQKFGKYTRVVAKGAFIA